MAKREKKEETIDNLIKKRKDENTAFLKLLAAIENNGNTDPARKKGGTSDKKNS